MQKACHLTFLVYSDITQPCKYGKIMTRIALFTLFSFQLEKTLTFLIYINQDYLPFQSGKILGDCVITSSHFMHIVKVILAPGDELIYFFNEIGSFIKLTVFH